MTQGDTVPDLSMLGLFLQADIVVKAVMALLVLASVACWAVILEKSFLLARFRREVTRLAAADPATAPREGEGLAASVLRAGTREWAEGRDEAESRGEFRERIERAMKAAMAVALRPGEHGLPLLATTGAVAPFVGLFGTVWGIMNAFAGIARSHDTSLAVVAPGIAEALLATAIGLAAAIPAVVAYNRLALRLGRVRHDGAAAIHAIGAALVRHAPRHLRAAAE